jgi:YesN/AraC family two-component response regulator
VSIGQDLGAKRARSITVVLVDDEQLIRSALAQALAAEHLELVGEATNAPDAVTMVLDLRPDVVLMDIRLPGSQGVRRSRRSACSRPPHAY